MTVAVQETEFRHIANGVSTVFAFSCQVLQASDLYVTADEVEVTSGFTISGIDDETGGEITFTVAPANGVVIGIDRIITLERLTDYQQNGDFLSPAVNEDYDRLWMAMQQHKNTLGRTIKLPVGDGASPILPSAASRANNLLGFDENGEIVAVAPAAQSASALQSLLATSSGTSLIGGTWFGGVVANVLDLASSLGASLIGFIQSGIGVVARSMQSKMRDVVSVKDFGAVGDWATDDTAAIQAAIDAVSITKQALYFPGTPNGYRITAPLVINTLGFRMYGDGQYVTQLNANGNFGEILKFNSSALYCTVENLSLNGGATTTRCVTVNANATVIRFSQCLLSGEKNGDLVYSNGQNVDLSECTINTGAANTWAANFDCFNQNCGVSDCRIGGPGNGIRITNAFSPANRVEGLRITNNYFINTGGHNVLVGSSLYTGICGNVLDQSSFAAVGVTTDALNVVIDGNYIGTSGLGTALGVLIDATAGGGHNISDNVIAYVAVGIKIAATAGNRVSNVAIVGNQFSTISDNCLQLDSVDNCTITGNVDSSSPTGGSWITQGTHSPGSYTFDNNHWHTGTVGSYHASSAYRFGNDTGIVGRNRGAAMPGGAVSSLVIAHGLFTTPTMVNFTIEGAALGNTWITSKNSTTFTANWTTASTPAVNWIAEV